YHEMHVDKSYQQVPGFNGPTARPGISSITSNSAPDAVLPCGHPRSRQDVTMAVEILGRRVHDDIGTKGERTAEHRRGHRVVDGQAGACFMRQAGCGGNVDELPERIARGFNP